MLMDMNAPSLLLATPDFGASGVIVLLLLVGWVILLLLVGLGIFVGTRLRRCDSGRAKIVGLLVIVVSILAPVICYVAPPHLFRLAYGSYPIGSYPNGTIKEGMSPAEVEAILGTPHNRTKYGKEAQWLYWIDPYGIRWFGVHFARISKSQAPTATDER